MVAMGTEILATCQNLRPHGKKGEKMKRKVFKGQQMEVACWVMKNLSPEFFKNEKVCADEILLDSLIRRHGIREVILEDAEPQGYQHRVGAHYFDAFFTEEIMTVVKKR